MPDRIYIDPSETNASVIQINGQCFERVGPSDHVPTVSSADYEFDTCEKCERDIFTLVDCDGVEDDVVVDNPDWGQHVGKVFDVDGTCRTVTEGGNPNDVVDKSPGTPFDSCPECWGCEDSVSCGSFCVSKQSEALVTWSASGLDGDVDPDCLGIASGGSKVVPFQKKTDAKIYWNLDERPSGGFRYQIIFYCTLNRWLFTLLDEAGELVVFVNHIQNICESPSMELQSSSRCYQPGASGNASISILKNGCCQNASGHCAEGSVDCATGDCTDDGGGA